MVRAPVEGLEAGTTTSAMRSTWVWSWREGGECIAVFGDRWIRWELVVTVELAAVLVGGEGAAAAGVGVPKTKVFGTRWERGELNRCGCCRNLLQNLKVTE